MTVSLETVPLVTEVLVLVRVALRSVEAGALDGAFLAAAAALLTRLTLRRSSGRVQAWVWLAVLLGFVLPRPFEVHAVPLRHATRQLLQAGADSGGAGASGWWLAGAGVYAALVFWLLARLVLGQWRLRRRIAGYPLAERDTQERVRAAARALALRRLPEVRVTDKAFGPFTCGPLRPMLVLPRWLCVPGARLDAVLLHELAHLKRRDHWCVWAQGVIVSVFFFWPPVYWVSRRLDAARELACDEAAIARGGFSITAYGNHLVEVVLAARESLGLKVGGALAIGRSTCRLEQRIDCLLEQAGPRRSRWIDAAVFSVLALCALLGVRPMRELAPLEPMPLAATPLAAIPLAELAPVTEVADESFGANLCVSEPEGDVPTCVLQGCGTQCAP